LNIATYVDTLKSTVNVQHKLNGNDKYGRPNYWLATSFEVDLDDVTSKLLTRKY